MVSRIVKYGLIGGVTLGTAAVATFTDDLAITRVSRTAVTVANIAFTYKFMLYSKSLDPDSNEYLEQKSLCHKICAKKLLALCETNRGVYIKVGQHIGALDYLLPDEYVKTMRVLHKDAPKNTVEQLYKVIREDLKKDPSEIFSDFEPEPLGTASLAQVHRAKLKDGQDVAVKVQHYFVRDNINLDLNCMEFFVNIVSKAFPDFEMEWLVDETRRNIYTELDFINEGRNAEKVARLFSSYSWLKVPKIYWDHSTDRVLVMEYVDGGQVNDIAYIKDKKIDPFDVCRKLGDLFSHMIFSEGFLHSDPHPGNILVQKNPGDKEVSIVLLDHGLYANLSDKFRYHYSKLWLSIISRNQEEMRIHSAELGVRDNLYILFACMVTGRPWQSILQGIDKIERNDEEKRLFQSETPKFLNKITECLQRVDRQALLVLKTNDLIRSIEFALGTSDQMLGFMVMTKCCMRTAYNYEARNASSLRGLYLRLHYGWSILILYLYSVYLGIIGKRDIKLKGVKSIGVTYDN